MARVSKHAAAALARPPPAARPEYWNEACRALGRGDPVMKGLIDAFPGSVLSSRGQPFVTLVRSIVGQQISVKAADAVWQRLNLAVAAISPEAILATEASALRGAGLSLRKVEYVRHLAERFGQGHIRPERWHAMDDAAIIDELVQTRGIGVWTAEMLLIFNLQRADVFPLDDIGLQKAVALHYCAGVRPARAELRRIGERWAPWRSVATWFLWRSLDPVPVEY
ncbi:MAG TPA: DNA-3-methyladenine glycosylase 2 family protein [Rhodocyclaceae bacterium]|nr:DNA-3-methyladenine glycosylase 2 family protein [Rhodocyclaceae bacterium]